MNKPWETDPNLVTYSEPIVTCDKVAWEAAQLAAARALYEAMEEERDKPGNNRSGRIAAYELTFDKFEKLLWPEGRKADGT